MSEELPQIFDCANLLALSEDKIEALSEERRDAYFGVVDTWTSNRDIQLAIADARSNLFAIVADCNALQAKFDKLAKVDRIDELRRTIAAQNNARVGLPPPPAPKVPAEAKKLAKAVEESNNAQAAARAMLFRAEEAAKVSQAQLAKAIERWQGMAKPDPIEVYRAHLKRQQDYAPRDPVAEAPPIVSPSHIDDVLSSGSKGANINYGFRRPRRGHTVPPPGDR